MKKTAGRWNANERNLYFVASHVVELSVASRVHNSVLCAINEIHGKSCIARLRQLADSGSNVFIDSGIFTLTNRHARAHRLTMDEVLSLPPQQIDGFNELFDRYCEVIAQLGKNIWGYIEIDQGGAVNKRKTRARLEALGFRPIPVYHPLNDGWEYFDELATQYDRICFGNIVQTRDQLRKSLIATAWERRRKYPHLWIHVLGLTLNEHCNAFPMDSADSSSWLEPVRWPKSFYARSAGSRVSKMPVNMRYASGSDRRSETGHHKAQQFGAYEAKFMERNWRSLIEDYALSGIDVNGYTTR